MVGQWNVPIFFLSCALALISVPFLLGFGAAVLPGFEFLSKEERKRIKKRPLCRMVGLMLLCLAIITMIYFFVGESFTIWFSIISALIVIVFILIIYRLFLRKKNDHKKD